MERLRCPMCLQLKPESEGHHAMHSRCGTHHSPHEMCPSDTSAKPSDTQVGGSHYKDFAIQPGVFSQMNKLRFFESNIIKYACRHRLKGSGREDIRKVIHYAQLILEEEYGVTK